MNTNQNNTALERSDVDIKAWMEEHPREYGEFAAAMGEADLLEVFFICLLYTSPSPRDS